MQEMKYFNEGNDCDICKNQLMTGRDGTVEDCRRKQNGLSCRFEERDIRTCPVCEHALANQTTKTNASKASLVEMESELEKVNKELKNHKLNEFASGCDKAGQKMESFGKKMSVVSAGIAAIEQHQSRQSRTRRGI